MTSSRKRIEAVLKREVVDDIKEKREREQFDIRGTRRGEKAIRRDGGGGEGRTEGEEKEKKSRKEEKA